jgi:hypothetical protein
MRRSIPFLMATAFGVLAMVPLAAAARAATDPSFRPGNFPAEAMALVALVLALTSLSWYLVSRNQITVGGWLMVFGSLFGLLLGAYGVWGLSVLFDVCAGARAVATSTPIDPNNPLANCDPLRSSMLIGYFMTGVGVLSAISLFAGYRIRRTGSYPALD